MIKSSIATLLIVLLSGLTSVQAQSSLDDVFAQLAAAEALSEEPAPVVETVAVAPAAVAGAVESGYLPELDEMALLFDTGYDFDRSGDFDQAIAISDAILFVDPYDSRAVVYKKRAAQRIGSKELRKQSATRAQAMSDINAAWNPEPKVNVAIDMSADVKMADPAALAIKQMEARLRGIVIPKLDFIDANIKEVVLFLTESCRRQDKGINILLLGMNSSDAMAAAESNITISIRDLNLYETLQYVVEMAAMKFEVKPSVVAITPVNYVALVDMVLQSYQIIPEVGADLESMSGADMGGGMDDLFGDTSSVRAEVGPIDVTGFFSIVDFPEGSSAVYQPNFHKLFVKNTPKNIKAIEDILADLEDEAIKKRSQQVEIEAKFVEFSEGALEELGFDWTLYSGDKLGELGLHGNGMQPFSGFVSDPDSIPDNTIDLAGGGLIFTDPVTGQQLASDPKGKGRPGQNLFGSSQRNNSGAFEKLQSGILSAMGGNPAAMFLGGNDFDLRITAMEQDGTADVLSAPKVTTKSGNEAIIRVVEVHRYPQDYDVETGQRTAPVVKPQDWENYDLGVVLKVTPVVDAESNTIDLDLHPEITKFKGYDQYKVGSNAYESGGNNSSELFGDGGALIALMPYFEVRSVQTQVTIADGHTVVMGGLVDERTETFRDQVPILGDIPYIGRLFRTEGSRTVKKNLVIYVTATQVDDRGMTRADREAARAAQTN